MSVASARHSLLTVWEQIAQQVVKPILLEIGTHPESLDILHEEVFPSCLLTVSKEDLLSHSTKYQKTISLLTALQTEERKKGSERKTIPALQIQVRNLETEINKFDFSSGYLQPDQFDNPALYNLAAAKRQRWIEARDDLDNRIAKLKNTDLFEAKSEVLNGLIESVVTSFVDLIKTAFKANEVWGVSFLKNASSTLARLP